jgi:acetylornithine deacetylase/succinyl-diaminopimelate desuccinylase-like protein
VKPAAVRVAGGLEGAVTASEYLAAHRPAAVEDLADFLRIPSISSLPDHRSDVERAAEWLAARLRRAGMEWVRVHPTPGHPVVTASAPYQPGRPTVLVYGHYDVQPVDPLSAWQTPPFEPSVRDGRLYGRGTSDDKGQLYMHILAAEALLRTTGLPVNLTFLFEGEEESGSIHLHEFIRTHQDLLKADVVVISDTPMYGPDMPAICYGLRGLAGLEVRVDGPAQDLHSGVFGGAVANPAHVLADLIHSLHTPDGRVAVSGFYDGVRELPASEREALAALPFDPDAFLQSTGSPALFGEPGFTTLERTWVRPTLDVNGMWSGFIGEGRKTIIPAYAMARITCRLVPHQDPAAVMDRVVAHLTDRCPDTVRLTVNRQEADPGILTPLDHPVVKATETAIRSVFGRDPVRILMGGSIPVVLTFLDVLQAPTVLLGFALPDEHFHAPNEYFTLENFFRGQDTIAALWQALAGWEV